MKLIILGAGGFGKTVFDIAQQSNLYEDIKFLDDNSTDSRVVGKCETYTEHVAPDTHIYPAFGNNEVRLNLIKELLTKGAEVPTFVHGTAYVSPTATLGKGTVVLPKAVVNTDVHVGDGVIVNCGALIDHGCVIEDGVHLCLGAIVKAENRIPTLMKVEAGEVIENRKFPL